MVLWITSKKGYVMRYVVYNGWSLKTLLRRKSFQLSDTSTTEDRDFQDRFAINCKSDLQSKFRFSHFPRERQHAIDETLADYNIH